MSLEMRDIPKNTVVYIDANIFIYNATGHPNYGEKCKEFLRRVERKELKGITSTLTIVLTKASNSFTFIEKIVNSLI